MQLTSLEKQEQGKPKAAGQKEITEHRNQIRRKKKHRDHQTSIWLFGKTNKTEKPKQSKEKRYKFIKLRNGKEGGCYRFQ